MNERITSRAMFYHAVSWRGIAGNNDSPVWRFEAITISVAPATMRNLKSPHLDASVFENETRLYFVAIYLVTLRIRWLETIDADVDIFSVCLQQMVHHSTRTWWSVNFKRLFPFKDPGTEY